MKELKEVFAKTPEELEAWLEKNHTQKESVWLVYTKKSKDGRLLPFETIVDILLCYGWIDSQAKKYDGTRAVIRISPRNPKSGWSRVNKAKISQLEKEGRLKPSGIEMVKIAKQSGAWDLLNDVEDLVVPPDLSKALEKNKLQDIWEAKSRSFRREVLLRLLYAKKQETRDKHINSLLVSLS